MRIVPPALWLPAAVAAASLLSLPQRAVAQATRENLAQPNNGPTTLPMGTVRGERVNRLVIRGATVLSGRGTPGTNRGMPPEGPVDIVIENGTIVDMVPMDAVNAAGYGRDFQRPTGDRVIDARGMYVMPGLVEMHAHLPSPNGELGARALDLAYRLYLGHGVTTVRDAGTGAGIERMAEQRRQLEANQIVGPRLVLCLRWPQPLRQWDEGNTPEKARAMCEGLGDFLRRTLQLGGRDAVTLGEELALVARHPDQFFQRAGILGHRQCAGRLQA